MAKNKPKKKKEPEVYLIEPDQPIDATDDPNFDSTRVQILAALNRHMPGVYFPKGLDFGEVDIDNAAAHAISGKCVFEVVSIGQRTLKKIQGGTIRFFDTDPNQVAATLNFFVRDEVNESYQGDILNVLLEKQSDGALEVTAVDYLVESRFF